MAGVLERLRIIVPLLRRREPDPFATLEIQLRLSRLSGELDMLAGPGIAPFAAAHHARAAELAYDASLAEACALIGADVGRAGGPADRLEMEATLVRDGWTW